MEEVKNTIPEAEVIDEVVEEIMDNDELTGEMLEEFTNGRGDIDE